MEHPHSHDHDSCTPDLDRDLAVTGIRAPGESPESPARPARAEKAAPSQVVEPVVEVTPLSLESEVIARSSQVPVVVLIGSMVDPGASALRRDLENRATGLRWILGVVDADRFPQVAGAFRPATLPSVTVVAGGTGVGTWAPADGADVDCGDWVEQVVATVEGRLDGLPEDAVTGDVDQGTTVNSLTADPRLQEAAELVGHGDAEAALVLYDRMLAEYSDPAAASTLHRARTAVAVLARTRDMDRSAVLSAVADARRGLQGAQGDVDTLLRAADVLVLLDRPSAAVELLSESLVTAQDGDGEADRVGRRLLELLYLLEPDDPVVMLARQRIAATVF
ncbi:hypothetical protein BJF89_05635 [Corynebacterium sp. CNJ-954]|uniref:tetratricopeptide repeat protein n=1 Tax=Corynebacterium sp. CNJ-954 TaxID=1904962 RepID=UPI00095C6ACF|nr:tetratricopeptide repeat protein [Corynebacterium sp. CNJ-954]OLT51930.1 hypothetical protein BJF89_05635 [Corynebacterium sp. CNJ-954]